MTVTRAVRAALEEAQKTLPPGVRIRTVYDQSELIAHALSSVQRAILVGGVLVVVVLFILLGNPRWGWIVTLTLPLSVVLAGIVMRWFGAGINTMTLGGLAIAVGILVDAAIIMTENIHHRLTTGTGGRRERVLQGAIEVGRPMRLPRRSSWPSFCRYFSYGHRKTLLVSPVGTDGRQRHARVACVIADACPDALRLVAEVHR